MIRLLKYEPVRYYCMSAIAVIIDVGLFQSMVLFGITAVAAAACSYAVAGVVHFITSRIWTFQAFHSSTAMQLPAYVAVVCTAWVATVLTVALFTNGFHVSPLAAKFIAMAAVLPIGYFGHKYVTFGRRFSQLVSSLKPRVRNT